MTDAVIQATAGRTPRRGDPTVVGNRCVIGHPVHHEACVIALDIDPDDAAYLYLD